MTPAAARISPSQVSGADAGRQQQANGARKRTKIPRIQGSCSCYRWLSPCTPKSMLAVSTSSDDAPEEPSARSAPDSSADVLLGVADTAVAGVFPDARARKDLSPLDDRSLESPDEDGHEYERFPEPLDDGHEGVERPEPFDEGVDVNPERTLGKWFTRSSKLNLRLSDDKTLSGLLPGWLKSIGCGVSPVVAPMWAISLFRSTCHRMGSGLSRRASSFTGVLPCRRRETRLEEQLESKARVRWAAEGVKGARRWRREVSDSLAAM
mmetsp:Transcript_58255/g.161520  ORF Transcript_58255/g.161520 Transcript_58255/m.161520 type:complete len:266 (+) Transcript_58255:233-1030(+)